MGAQVLINEKWYKSTYASQLADRLGAVRFSIDEWMRALYWMDSPQPLDPDWSMQRVKRCQAQIWEVARRIAERGLPCVLDVGLGQALSRARLAELARDAGLSVQLHFVDAPTEERWRRVETRNVEKGDTYQLEFDVTREMFDFVESIWEPPTDAEMTACDGIRVSTIQNTEASK